MQTSNRVFTDNGSWFFLDWEKRQACLFSRTTPKVGDEFRAKMKSGKIARFVATSVDTPHDPGDQHFITFEDLGYL